MELIYIPREGGPFALTPELSWEQYLEVLKTGELGGLTICAIEHLQQPTVKEVDKAIVQVFDFACRRAGLPDIKCYRDIPREAVRALR